MHGPNSIRIRLALADDVAAIADVEQDASNLFLETRHAAETTADVLPPDVVARQIARELVWVANAADMGVVAFALVMELGSGPHLHELSVRTGFMRRGLGTALIEQVCSAMRVRGHRQISLCTFSDVPWNRPFYLRLGFRDLPEAEWSSGLVEVCREERAQGLDMAFRVVMIRDLVEATPG